MRNIDLSRRFFLFGTAATSLAISPARSFFLPPRFGWNQELSDRWISMSYAEAAQYMRGETRKKLPESLLISDILYFSRMYPEMTQAAMLKNGKDKTELRLRNHIEWNFIYLVKQNETKARIDGIVQNPTCIYDNLKKQYSGKS